MANDLIPYGEWMKRTTVLGHTRSKALKELDEELKRYEQFGGGQARWAVGQKLEAWKKTKGPGEEWKSNRRNRGSRVVEELTALLDGKGDTDAGVSGLPDFMHPDLVNARLGVLYLFGNLDVDSNMFNVILEGGMNAAGGVLTYAGADTKTGGLGNSAAKSAATNLGTAWVPAKAIFNSAESAGYRTAITNPNGQRLAQRFRNWLREFVSKLVHSLRQKFGDIDVSVAAIKNLIKVCTSAFLSSAAPFISSGMDIAKGAVNTFDAAMVNFRTWWRSRDVQVAVGHPATIVSSIRRGMVLSLFEGLYQMLKGSASAALTAATAGAAMIVNVAVALGEMVIKLIWRMVEITRMDRFFQQAAAHWRNRGAPDAIHRKPIQFGRWFRDAALNLPALSVLALNSGICGDKMQFLKMYKADGDQITQGDFKRGVRFIDGLKPWGAEYLGKCGYEFRGKSEFTAKLLDFSAVHAKQRNKGWRIVRKIANA